MKQSLHKLLLAGVMMMSCAAFALEKIEERDERWAQPVEMPGIPNLYRVTKTLYRSGQPTEEGFLNMDKLGIKTVLCLRVQHPDKEYVEGTNIKLVEIPMQMLYLKDEEILQALEVMVKEENQPVLVHCLFGSDRTGMLCAMYRLVVEDWKLEDALKELVKGGYGFHEIFSNITEKITNLHVKRTRMKLGVKVRPKKYGEK